MYAVVRLLLKFVFRLLFRARITDGVGLGKLPSRAVFLVPNISAIDPLILMAYLPGRPVFALSKRNFSSWSRFFMYLAGADVFFIDNSNAENIKNLAGIVRNGRWAVIFAEGKVYEAGMIAKVYEAPGLIAENAGAVIVPVMVSGVQYGYSSYMEGVAHRPFPHVRLNFLEARKVPKSRYARESREKVGDYLYRVMQEAFYATQIDRRASIFACAMRAAKLYGHKGIHRTYKIEDSDRKPQSYKDVLVKSFALASRFNKVFGRGEHVGVMLPNSIANLCAFLGLSAYGRVPAMLNFTQGEKNVLNCCKMAVVRKIITSRKFVSALGLDELVKSLEAGKVRIFYLEDMAAGIKLWGRIEAFLKYKYHYVPNRKGGRGAKGVILFTSGSEGMPKAVALSQYNMISNIAQLICSVGVGSTDVWFNALPMFHSFGLTVCTLAPFMMGMKLFLYPTPLHYRVIPEICYDIGATIMAGTNTFLKNYAKCAHPYDFNTMRIAINGAEILREDTRALWVEKFGVRIIQGYGATETSPAIAINSPIYNRTGSVGRILPGMEYKLRKLDGVKSGGELMLRGDNIMMGYMKLDAPGKIVPPKDGWYATGDVVEIDADGFLFIRDRIKRFAKLGGEMVSLSSVENLVKDAYEKEEELEVAAVAVPDDAKGERIVLVATSPYVGLASVAEYARRQKVSELYVPKSFMYMEAIPLLKTGKRDYVALRELALKKFGAGAL